MLCICLSWFWLELNLDSLYLNFVLCLVFKEEYKRMNGSGILQGLALTVWSVFLPTFLLRDTQFSFLWLPSCGQLNGALDYVCFGFLGKNWLEGYEKKREPFLDWEMSIKQWGSDLMGILVYVAADLIVEDSCELDLRLNFKTSCLSKSIHQVGALNLSFMNKLWSKLSLRCLKSFCFYNGNLPRVLESVCKGDCPPISFSL